MNRKKNTPNIILFKYRISIMFTVQCTKIFQHCHPYCKQKKSKVVRRFYKCFFFFLLKHCFNISYFELKKYWKKKKKIHNVIYSCVHLDLENKMCPKWLTFCIRSYPYYNTVLPIKRSWNGQPCRPTGIYMNYAHEEIKHIIRYSSA